VESTTATSAVNAPTAHPVLIDRLIDGGEGLLDLACDRGGGLRAKNATVARNGEWMCASCHTCRSEYGDSSNRW